MKSFLFQIVARVLYPLVTPYIWRKIEDPGSEWDEKAMAALDAIFGRFGSG